MVGITRLVIASLFAGIGLSLALTAEEMVPVVLLQPEDIVPVAQSLESPDGLAFHPLTHELYVSEETAGAVSVLRNGSSERVIQNGSFTILDDLPPWAYTSDQPLSFWTRNQLASPEGIAFDKKGHLYVTEDSPNGRLLEFLPDAQGAYTTARVVPVPWDRKNYAWESVSVADDGRLLLAGSSAEAVAGLFYGVTLLRDTDGDWWVADFGPFASFSATGFTPKQDAIFIAEEISGAVAWWDATRHVEIGSTESVLPNIESVDTFPDGSILAAQESVTPLGQRLEQGRLSSEGGGRIVRINPATQEIRVIASDLGKIEDVRYDAVTHRIYVSEDDTGRVLSMPVPKGLLFETPVMEQAVFSQEVAEGRAPRKWPTFLKDFVAELGVQPIDEEAGMHRRGEGIRLDKAGSQVTLEEFSDMIPMVAMKLKVVKALSPTGSDPLDELSCIVFYPGQQLMNGATANPSLCLFAARYKSGNVEVTRELMGLQSVLRQAVQAPGIGNASMYIPLATCNAQAQHRGHSLTMTFLGADMMDDYYVTLENIREDKGILNLRLKDGGLEHYEVTFLEKDQEGNVRRNLVLAGFNRMSNEPYGWYKIGDSPAPTLLTMTDGPGQILNKRTQELADLAMKKQKAWELARLGPDRNQDEFYLAEYLREEKKDSRTTSAVMVKNGKRVDQNGKEIAAPDRPSRRPSDHAEKEGEGRHAEQPTDEQRAHGKKDAESAREEPAVPVEEQMRDLFFSKALEEWTKKSEATF